MLMADRACNCWVFFISNKCNGLIFSMEFPYLNIRIILFVSFCICLNLFDLPRPCDRRNEGVYVTM